MNEDGIIVIPLPHVSDVATLLLLLLMAAPLILLALLVITSILADRFSLIMALVTGFLIWLTSL